MSVAYILGVRLIVPENLNCFREEGMPMKFGFIGAGKVGFSLGKFFKTHGMEVVGYYSLLKEDAISAASFTQTNPYDSLEELVRDSDVLFLTVPDDNISDVWDELNSIEFKNKIVCHTSGSLSSEIFSGIDNHSSYGYSIHPLFALSDPYKAYKELSNVYFTIEGHEEKLSIVKGWFDSLGVKTRTIKTEDKVLYHAAAAMASNLVVGLIDMAESFIPHEALVPIMEGNMKHIVRDGTTMALTGPIERGDIATVQKHMKALSDDKREAYVALSKQVLNVARRKNPARDYSEMQAVLDNVLID